MEAAAVKEEGRMGSEYFVKWAVENQSEGS